MSDDEFDRYEIPSIRPISTRGWVVLIALGALTLATIIGWIVVQLHFVHFLLPMAACAAAIIGVHFAFRWMKRIVR